MPAAVRDGIRLSIGTFTAIPVPPPRMVDRGVARLALVLAPLAVLPVVLVAVATGYGLSALFLPDLAVGLTVVGILQLGTRAMHADGLADTVDGLGASWDRERALTVMRSGDVGPMGTVALILVLGGQAACLAPLVSTFPGALVTVVALAGSRAAVLFGAIRPLPAARPDGLGATVAGSIPIWLAVASWLVVSGILAGTAPIWWRGVVAAGVAVAGGWWLLRLVVRRIGGITGDVLGALIEVSALLLLVVLSLG